MTTNPNRGFQLTVTPRCDCGSVAGDAIAPGCPRHDSTVRLHPLLAGNTFEYDGSTYEIGYPARQQHHNGRSWQVELFEFTGHQEPSQEEKIAEALIAAETALGSLTDWQRRAIIAVLTDTTDKD